MNIKEVHDAINLSLKHGAFNSRRLIFDTVFQAGKGLNVWRMACVCFVACIAGKALTC